MGEPAVMRWTVEEFLDWEATQEERYELIDGEVRLMVGAPAVHNRVVMNLSGVLFGRLAGGPCEVWSQSQKLQIEADVFYPDVFVTCGRIDDRALVAEDAVLVAEVLSPSTLQHDLVTKAPLYRGLPSLRHLLFLTRTGLKVDHYRREASGWYIETLTAAEDVIELTGLDISLRLAEIYRGTDTLRGE